MSGFLLRLAGPMQSWGEHSVYGTRDTLSFPTRSGLIGMFAAARGLPRGAGLADYEPLRLTVRVDRPGVRMSDFHTVGGGAPPGRTVPTAEGKRKAADVATIVTHRGYLAGAVFTVAVEAPHDLADRIAADLRNPHWAPYLGRRSHVPDPPLLLRARVSDPVGELRTGVPLPRPESWQQRHADTIAVDLVHEGEHESSGGYRERTVLNDVPRTFDAARRAYATRPVTVAREPLPAALFRWRDHAHYLDALYGYVREGT